MNKIIKRARKHRGLIGKAITHNMKRTIMVGFSQDGFPPVFFKTYNDQ
jgi:hypothetical protein